MLNLQHRINLLVQLGNYILENGAAWQEAKAQASRMNAWFTPEFIDQASRSIASNYLSREALEDIAAEYQLPATNEDPKTVGLVMAGNIPLVGFHDWLCIFLTGHHALVKPSSKDAVLFRHLLGVLYEWEVTVQNQTGVSEMLKGCDAYIATGSDNTARYFDYYFGRYPSVIRRNRTSVAVLDGTETPEELDALADDVHLYFGLGCRNVTRILVPEGYDFEPLLNHFRRYSYFFDHAKYKNNYDYQLAVQLLNNKYYMTNGALLLVENESNYSPISQLNYSFYTDKEAALNSFRNNPQIQCLIGHDGLPFGTAQHPSWKDYADGVDTMAFLLTL